MLRPPKLRAQQICKPGHPRSLSMGMHNSNDTSTCCLTLIKATMHADTNQNKINEIVLFNTYSSLLIIVNLNCSVCSNVVTNSNCRVHTEKDSNMLNWWNVTSTPKASRKCLTSMPKYCDLSPIKDNDCQTD